MKADHDDARENAMSVLKYAAAAAIGYLAGRPAARRQLARARTAVTQRLSSPQGDGRRRAAVLDRVRRKGAERPVSVVSPETEFSGRALAEERRANATPPA